MNETQYYFSDEKPEKCPGCGSEKVAGVLWGMPAYSDELQRDMDTGKVVLGGCCVSDCDPSWACVECGAPIYKERLRGEVGKHGPSGWEFE